ncbi:MAG: 50S ribosomal protein L4 [Candidatus Omnitrophica bacterium]|nr:50S ribosomal protein L4 [Candidatus Omnitrophota bacterium]
MMEKAFLDVYNTEAEIVDKIELDSLIFDGRIDKAVVHQAICMYLANQRKGLASTKTRGEVSGGGCKPWRQKGTGRSRHGSIRSPLWRGGGVVFGPHPRDYSYNLPSKIKLLAVKSGLNARLKEGNLKIIEDIKPDIKKTKELINMLSKLDLYKKKTKPSRILILIDKPNVSLKKAGENLRFLEIGLAKDLNILQLLRAKKVVFTRMALKQIIERLKKRRNIREAWERQVTK